ncbi:putative target of rapamycin (TOR) kinase 1 [Trypanosoma cruzi]|nr:putative target of rapamycin (TOR) kinase 1 [Trypanosoma cruzi]
MVALPFHISQYLGAMWDEAAALLDVDASFYRRFFWRIRTGEFRLSSGTRGSRGVDSPHTGRECCPEVPRTTARVLAEDPGKVRPQSVVPRVVRAPVWICSIRTSGLRRSVVRRGQCAAKKWRQRENRRPFSSGVNLLVYP